MSFDDPGRGASDNENLLEAMKSVLQQDCERCSVQVYVPFRARMPGYPCSSH